MSADLFDLFGVPPAGQQTSNTGPPKPQPAPTNFFDDFTAPAPASQNQQQAPNPQTTDTNDDWGDFEGVSSADPVPVKQDPFAFPAQPSSFQPPQTSWQPAPVYKAKKSYDSNVLFDAEEDAGEDDDDFGDFEGPASGNSAPVPPPPAPSSGLIDLLGDLEISSKPPVITQRGDDQHRRTGSTTSTTSKARGFGSIPAKSKETPPIASSPAPKQEQEDSWDSFDDWEASIPTKVPGKTTPKPPSPGIQTPAPPSIISNARSDDPQPGETPPTNVPPPGMLLSLFPPLFTEAHEKLFKPMAAQTLPMRNRLLSEPATIAYLEGYLALASVAARIIAGRKLRWKRDVHLSQGMRIGPASSRATSGMKLTGIDKSENMKEEREVSDLIRAWKEQVGRLRHAVSAVNTAKAGSLGAVPDLQETMPVRTLKQAEGGIPAPQPCMLCGLKRDERVTAADASVIDGFGEWWIEQVNMHRGCRNFWNEHKDRLRQR